MRRAERATENEIVRRFTGNFSEPSVILAPNWSRGGGGKPKNRRINVSATVRDGFSIGTLTSLGERWKVYNHFRLSRIWTRRIKTTNVRVPKTNTIRIAYFQTKFEFLSKLRVPITPSYLIDVTLRLTYGNSFEILLRYVYLYGFTRAITDVLYT